MKTRILLSFLTAGFILESAIAYRQHNQIAVLSGELYAVVAELKDEIQAQDDESFEVVAPEQQVSLL